MIVTCVIALVSIYIYIYSLYGGQECNIQDLNHLKMCSKRPISDFLLALELQPQVMTQSHSTPHQPLYAMHDPLWSSTAEREREVDLLIDELLGLDSTHNTEGRVEQLMTEEELESLMLNESNMDIGEPKILTGENFVEFLESCTMTPEMMNIESNLFSQNLLEMPDLKDRIEQGFTS